MTDPDRIYDTDPMGGPFPGEEDPADDDDAVTEPDEPWFEELPAEPDDTDDFWSWPETFAPGVGRAAELVKRPASDGARFAAYACEGRPVAASEPVRLEPSVSVQTEPLPEDPEREALTVPTGDRRSWRWRTLGWAAFGVVAAGGFLAGWTWGQGANAPTRASTAPAGVGGGFANAGHAPSGEAAR